ncbi:MAG: glycosyltransferase family 4 protein [Bacteroidetes bacterium]|nr:glycosyltransferase family 4 protein [Bacteroidota bacterium]
MKVLLLTDGIYPYAMGGMQKHSANLARYLFKTGVDITLAHCIYVKDRVVNNKDIAGVIGIPSEKIFTFRFPQSFHFPGHYINNSKRYSKLLFEQFKNRLSDFDIVYSQGFTAWELLKRTTPNTRPPVVLNMHGVEMYQPSFSQKEKFEKILMRIPANFLIQHTDYIHSLGGALTPIIKNIAQTNAIWECGIGLENFWFKDAGLVHKPNNVLRFVFIGRNELRKGLHLLNPVIEELIKSGSKFSVDFIGDVPDSLRLRVKNIHYHGQIKTEEKIISIIDDCDILLLPSLSEGMPTVILEAMARGLALIATRVGAVETLVDSQNGWLIEAGSKESLQNAMKSAIHLETEQILKMKLLSLEKVKKYEWMKIAKEHLQFFESIKRD